MGYRRTGWRVELTGLTNAYVDARQDGVEIVKTGTADTEANGEQHGESCEPRAY